jgi:hypothetical protein
VHKVITETTRLEIMIWITKNNFFNTNRFIERTFSFREISGYITWYLRVARLFVCIGDWGMTPFDGGIPRRPHIKVWHHKCKYFEWSKKIKLERTIRGEGNTNICIPETPKEASHNGKKMAFSNWTPSAEKVEMLHYGQNSKAPRSS